MQRSILQGIGNTPLLRLYALEENHCQLYVKLENKNPGGSIKDRMALYMVEKALEEGKISLGGTVIEPTSGNTGIALAMICAVMGLQCCIVMPESMSIERQKLIKAHGAKLILTPAALGMAGATQKAQELLQSQSNAFMLDQFSNAHGIQAHYVNTGPEIAQTLHENNLTVDVLVAGVGTGATLSGTGLYLREHMPQVRIYAVEPAESPLLSQGKSGPHAIQGIGANFIPSNLRRDIIDEVHTVSAEQAFAMARRLMTHMGISCGISSGANVHAALQISRQEHMQGKSIVTFICDTGERYLSTKLFET